MSNRIVATALAAAVTGLALCVNAQAPSKGMPAGDAERGEEQFAGTCEECHGVAATAPTLRGIINREVASAKSFDGYSEAMKAKKPMKWTKENIFTYLEDPAKFIPGNMMYREYPEAQMRADVIAYLETLPPPKQ
jgi:cytochrome c